MATASDGSGQFYAIPGDAGDPACDHDAVHGLGSDGGLNGYFECSSCGSVLVREVGGFAGDDGATDDLGTVDPRLEDLLEDIEAYHDGRRSPFEAAPPETAFDRLAGALRRLIP